MLFFYGFGTKIYVTVTARIFSPKFSSVLYQIEKSGNEYDLKENYRIPYVEKEKDM